MAPRITYNGNDIDLVMGKTDLKHVPRQRRNQNVSGSGKIETINLFGRWDYEFDSYFARSVYYSLWAWWSWARQGKGFSFALDSANTGYTKLDAAAASAQKVIPVTTTSDFSAGDFCLIRAVDNDDEFEIIEIDSVSAGVSITAVDNLIYGYTASALGSELVTDGDFSAADPNTAWTATNGATLTSPAGGKAGDCLQITCDGSDNPVAYQDINITAGESYLFYAYVKAGTEATYRVEIYDSANPIEIFSTGILEETAGDWSTEIHTEYVAPIGTSVVRVHLYQMATAGAGSTLLFDSVSLKKINADTLSHKDYFAKVITTEKDFRPTLTGISDNTSRYYKHTFKFTENL